MRRDGRLSTTGPGTAAPCSAPADSSGGGTGHALWQISTTNDIHRSTRLFLSLCMSIGCLSGLMAWLLLAVVDAADKPPCAATWGRGVICSQNSRKTEGRWDGLLTSRRSVVTASDAKRLKSIRDFQFTKWEVRHEKGKIYN
jgi:hypothetical protein